MDRAEGCDGHKVEGTFRSHQVPLAEVRKNPAHCKQLENGCVAIGRKNYLATTGDSAKTCKRWRRRETGAWALIRTRTADCC